MILARVYQGVLNIASHIVVWKMPKLIKGSNAIDQAAKEMGVNKHKKMLIVTDLSIYNLGLTKKLEGGLSIEGIEYYIYKDTVANPTIKNVMEGVSIYNDNGCDGIIAIGGGSAIDCAKGVSAQIARPNKPLVKMEGVQKVCGKTPKLYAIPTTSGTGSETTMASVITDDESHVKHVISDFSLIPDYAILDAKLTEGLPANITAWTGVDALTHAIEAYLGKSNTRGTIKHAMLAISLIDKYLYRAYTDGSDILAREKMQLASYYAGVAFTRAYVGNVHAVAHAIGGKYNIQHGLANAIVLPKVLEYYGKSIYSKMSKLADLLALTEIGDSNLTKCNKVIEYIRELNAKMNIPTNIPEIKYADIDEMINLSYKEAVPLYPTPKVFTKKDFANIYIKLRG